MPCVAMVMVRWSQWTLRRYDDVRQATIYNILMLSIRLGVHCTYMMAYWNGRRRQACKTNQICIATVHIIQMCPAQ